MTNRGVTEFVGVSTDPRSGVLKGVGPYEFFTSRARHCSAWGHEADDQDRHVDLTDCASLRRDR